MSRLMPITGRGLRPPVGISGQRRMGYEVHITRAETWIDGETHPISLGEWLQLVESDPELMIGPVNGEPGEPGALWVVDGSERTWFQWSGGNIETKHPERDAIGEMLEIAAHFGAKVQGDEGEVYPTADHWPDRGVDE